MGENNSEKLDYFLSSLDELGETLINHDQTNKVSMAVLRLTLGTVMASKGAILLYNKKSETLFPLAIHGLKKQCDISYTNGFVEKIEKFNDINCIIQEVNLDAKEIRNIAEQLKERISGVVALFSITENKLTIVIAINKNLTNNLDSQKIIKELGPIIGGGGGGKPGIAQAGGSNIKGIKEAIELTRTLIKDGLK